MSLEELYATQSILYFDEIAYCLCTIALIILFWLWFAKMYCHSCVSSESNSTGIENASLPKNLRHNKHRIQSTSPTSLSPKSKSIEIPQLDIKEDSKYHSFDPRSHERATEMTDTHRGIVTPPIESPPTQSVDHGMNLHEIHIPEDNLSDIEQDEDIIIITTPKIYGNEKEPNVNTLRSITEFEGEHDEHQENGLEIICHSENEMDDAINETDDRSMNKIDGDTHHNKNNTVCTLQLRDLSPPSPLNRSVSNESKTKTKDSKDPDPSHHSLQSKKSISSYDDYCDTRKSIHPVAKYLVTATIICAVLFSITITMVVTTHFLGIPILFPFFGLNSLYVS